MLTDHQNDTRDLSARKATAVLKPDRIKPDLGAVGIALDMHMGRLRPISREKEAAVRTDTKNGGHSEE